MSDRPEDTPPSDGEVKASHGNGIPKQPDGYLDGSISEGFEDPNPEDAGTDAPPEPQTPIDSGAPDARPDAPPTPTTSVSLTWNAQPAGFEYALAVLTPGGAWITPCLSDAVLGSATSITYEGTCTSASNQAVPNPAAYRLYFSNNGHWSDYVEKPAASAVSFVLPTTPATSLPVTWNRKTATADYSLDIIVSGELIGPCINANTLQKATSFNFAGTCTGTGTSRKVDIGKITEFRICWAENNNWGAASCAGAPFNGLGRWAKIQN